MRRNNPGLTITHFAYVAITLRRALTLHRPPASLIRSLAFAPQGVIAAGAPSDAKQAWRTITIRPPCDLVHG
ncbi:hypothetical protein GCM10010195_75110 [Kitasatospora griseola]|nr:hypothetical protein GCM10010195_75110 [Kitasatospora griseola]